VQKEEKIFLDILEDDGFQINEIMDYTLAEEDNVFLKGQVVCFWIEKMVKLIVRYLPRADEELMIEFCEDFEYTPVISKLFKL